MKPADYIVLQHALRLDRPVQDCNRWMDRIPAVYHKAVPGRTVENTGQTVENDPNCLAVLRHYRSLVPLTQEARKPMFFLKPADSAIGGHVRAVLDGYRDFKALALKILEIIEKTIDEIP